MQNVNEQMEAAAKAGHGHMLPFIQSGHPMTSPEWLRKIAPDAEIHEELYNIFESFKDGDQCLASVMKSVTGQLESHTGYASLLQCQLEHLHPVDYSLLRTHAERIKMPRN